MTDRPVTPAALTDELLRKAYFEYSVGFNRVFCSSRHPEQMYEGCHEAGLAAMRAVLAPALEPQTCSTCQWMRATGPSEDAPDYLCTREPQEWPMHWSETWPTFGCVGHSPTPPRKDRGHEIP